MTFPEGLKIIDDYAFRFCTSLLSISLPNTLEIIGDYAFDNCESLKDVTLPNSLISIGKYAFYKCKNLKNIFYQGTKAEWKKIEKKGWKPWYYHIKIFFKE